MGGEVVVFHGGKVEEEGQLPRAKAVFLESLAELVGAAEEEGGRVSCM